MRRACATAGICAALLFALATPVRAQRFSVEGDGYARAEPGIALLVLRGEGAPNELVSAEALVWGGLRDGGEADVLVVAVDVRDRERRVGGRVGRFVESLGALRPVHMDGASVWARLPLELRVDAFGGVPVVVETDERAWDWLAGGRLSRAIGDWGSVGLAYVHRRDAGALSDEELGLDAGAAIDDGLEVHGRAAYDLVDPGFSEARISGSLREGPWYGELFATHRSASRILPQTSLFSVLGDVASEHVGASGRWRAAPRLDVESTAALRFVGSDVGPSLRLAGRLRLDEHGRSATTLEARREPGGGEGGFTGVRFAIRAGIVPSLALVSELELAVPDDPPENAGTVWPWALAGAQWDIDPRWQLAGAVTAEASPRHASRFDALVRVTHRWEVAR